MRIPLILLCLLASRRFRGVRRSGELRASDAANRSRRPDQDLPQQEAPPSAGHSRAVRGDQAAHRYRRQAGVVVCGHPAGGRRHPEKRPRSPTARPLLRRAVAGPDGAERRAGARAHLPPHRRPQVRRAAVARSEHRLRPKQIQGLGAVAVRGHRRDGDRRRPRLRLALRRLDR